MLPERERSNVQVLYAAEQDEFYNTRLLCRFYSGKRNAGVVI